MSTSRIDLKNRWLAALLAYLVPGLGHFYQRRWFKGAIYAACILPTFFWGLYLGQWQIVYFRWEPGDKTIGYISQFFVGLPALPALIQAWRYESPSEMGQSPGHGPERLFELDSSVSAPFQGRFITTGYDSRLPDENVSGQIQLERVPGEFGAEAKGVFEGMTASGTPLKLQLAGAVEISPKLFACEGIPTDLLPEPPDQSAPVTFTTTRRYVKCNVLDQQSHFAASAGYLEGTVPRAVWNWFQVPLEDQAKQNLHRRLGRFVELAQILTWIAGLLNLLAIWDALEGPAYGYGDEREADADSSEKNKNHKTTTASAENQAGSTATAAAASLDV